MKKESKKDLLRPGRMSNTLIRNLIHNYRKNHMSAINSTLGIEDAHSIWFDLPKLKKFISIIEEEAGKINPETSEKDLGIRFYYAAYPETENWDMMESHPVPKEYAGKHTLVMVPTLKKKSEAGEILDYDFNPQTGNDGSLALASNTRGKKPSTDNETIGENNGTLIPPGDPVSEIY